MMREDGVKNIREEQKCVLVETKWRGRGGKGDE
jgi:hypothetical protein